MTFTILKTTAFIAAAATLVACGGGSDGGKSAGAKERKLLNVSYDPTRELYAEYNVEFAKYWKEKTGETVTI